MQFCINSKTGVNGARLPQDYPNWQTVYSQFRRWKINGASEQALVELERIERAARGKKEHPSLLIGDSMCARNTDTANLLTKGFCHYKSTNGIKRHLLVDVIGNPYFVHCTPGNVSDDEGLIQMIEDNKEYFLGLPPEPVVTILLDNGYHKDHLEDQISRIDPLLRNKILIELAPKIRPEEKSQWKKEHPEKQGFVVIKMRWIVERTNAWINQCLGAVEEL